jgi:gluconate 2-dehydrogenase subunit 3-like protein
MKNGPKGEGRSRQSSGREIPRREILKRLAGGTGAGLAFPAIASSHPMHKHWLEPATVEAAAAKAADPEWKPEFLDDHQNETVAALAERIVPGSAKAQSNRFIDLVLTVSSPDDQRKFLVALGAFDSLAVERYGHPFRELAQDQQNNLLTEASTAKSGHVEGKEDFAWFAIPSGAPHQSAVDSIRDYFDEIKQWVVGAYYSSEVGMRELGWTGNVMFESFPGCEHPESHT